MAARYTILSLIAFGVRNCAALQIESAESPQDPLAEVFCWAVEGPSDYTIALLRHQMKACGKFVVFSNYSDASTSTIKLYNGSMETGLTPGGWASNTGIFTQAWEYIATSVWPERYNWFVKLDADTFFRPRYLPKLLAKIDYNEPTGLGVDGRMRGALEILSYRVFRHENTKMIYQRSEAQINNPYLGGEDVWIGDAMKRAGFKLVEAPRSDDGCTMFLISYFNLPDTYKDLPMSVGGTRNVRPKILVDGMVRKPTNDGRCLHKSVVAIHPAKDIAVYQEFKRVDESTFMSKV